jgi:hypothetical protein
MSMIIISAHRKKQNKIKTIIIVRECRKDRTLPRLEATFLFQLFDTMWVTSIKLMMPVYPMQSTGSLISDMRNPVDVMKGNPVPS